MGWMWFISGLLHGGAFLHLARAFGPRYTPLPSRSYMEVSLPDTDIPQELGALRARDVRDLSTFE